MYISHCIIPSLPLRIIVVMLSLLSESLCQ